MTDMHTSQDWLSDALGLADGATPFPWQRRLLNAMVSGQLPATLDLPTGLGKTSVMAIWLVARALGAPVPRRLVYVVDRRAVVDQATSVAEGLRAWVDRDDGVRQALGLASSLPISTLRGQFTDNRQWLADPAAPAIVLGTVDMVGSRLLFGGYGVSSKMRPYHAALLGADALLVLDEAHLVPPFECLVERIAARVDGDGQRLGERSEGGAEWVPPMRLLSLSATGRRRGGASPFALDAEDQSHPVVQQRLQASKHLMCFPGVDAKVLPEALAEHAWTLAAQGRKAARVVVFTNSRNHAQKVHATLTRFASKGPGAAVELFVGGRRVHERTEAAARLQALGFVAGSSVALEGPAFLVATSAAEVGVDLDADHAVCDLVTWERMVQRLGRVNRRGLGQASVVVVPSLPSDTDEAARQAAVHRVIDALPRLPDGAFDASPAALAALKQTPEHQALVDAASTPAPLHPPLSLALLEAWAMTSLDHHTGRPEVEPWLRGWLPEPEPPQVRLLWRRLLPLDHEGELLPKAHLDLFLEAAGPHLSETLETEVYQALDWLLARAKSLTTAATPPDGGTTASETAEGAQRLAAADVIAVLIAPDPQTCRPLRAADITPPRRRDLERLLAGATLMLDSRFGGLAHGLLDPEAGGAAPDVSEAGMPAQPGPVPFSVHRVATDAWPELPAGWREEAAFPVRSTDEGVAEWLIVRSRIEQQPGSEEGRSAARRAQLLSEHHDWTEATARRLGGALGLPDHLVDMLATAAALHDEGKRAARWQQAFHAPNAGRPPYAKTVGRPDLALLDGYRHEFGSLPYVEADARVQAMPAELRDLCLHLIAAHHGAARPVIRTNGAPEPPSVLARRAQEVALRYARLSRQWGPWGLAWWEALLRAADQQASRANDEEGASHG